MEKKFNSTKRLKKDESVNIIFLGAAKTSKSLLLNNFIDLKSRNKIRKISSNNVVDLESVESIELHNTQIKIDEEDIYQGIDIAQFQDVVLLDCPGTNYFEMIAKIEEKLKKDYEIVPENTKHEIRLLKNEAFENIKEFIIEIKNVTLIKNFDIHVIIFDYSNMKTFSEAEF